MNPSEEIKAKLDIVEILREYIQLKPAGVNFRALCPFHNEKTPSFVVSAEKQIWHCFGCGKGGDVLSFVQEMEGLSFPEVLRLLAPKAGVSLKGFDKAKSSQRNRLLDAMELSVRYYQAVLKQSKEAGAAKEYLAGRGLKQETIDEWRIGYSRDSWDDIIKVLKQRGFTDSDIFSAGLSVRSEKAQGYYNRFRGRIMFPICDINGNPVAFTARVSPDREKTDKMGKYVNSPQTEIYNKSKILFGLDKAKIEIKKKDRAILVEGQMDVITSHQAGFKNTVASSGTAITGEQISSLQRYTNNLIFALDSDQAGQAATDKGEAIARQIDYKEEFTEDPSGRIRKYIDPQQSYVIDIKVIEIPEGKDPDDFIRKHPDGWQELIDNARPIMQYYFDTLLKAVNLSTADGRRSAISLILPKIMRLGNKIDQDFWVLKLAQQTGINEGLIREQLRSISMKRGPQANKVRNAETPLRIAPKDEKLSELLVASILMFPRNLEYVSNNLRTEQIRGDDCGLIYRKLVIYYNNEGKELLLTDTSNSVSKLFFSHFKEWLAKTFEQEGYFVDTDDLMQNIPAQIIYLDKLMLLGERDYYDFSEEHSRQEIIRLTIELKKNYLINKTKEIERLILKLEEGRDNENGKELESLMRELKILNDERQDLEAKK